MQSTVLLGRSRPLTAVRSSGARGFFARLPPRGLQVLVKCFKFW
jgi:hypothetical protein